MSEWDFNIGKVAFSCKMWQWKYYFFVVGIALLIYTVASHRILMENWADQLEQINELQKMFPESGRDEMGFWLSNPAREMSIDIAHQISNSEEWRKIEFLKFFTLFFLIFSIPRITWRVPN